MPEAVAAPGRFAPVRLRLAAATEVARTGLEVLSVALIAVYTLLVLLQVFFRYVLNEPLFWAEEVIRYGLVWSVMLGSAATCQSSTSPARSRSSRGGRGNSMNHASRAAPAGTAA